MKIVPSRVPGSMCAAVICAWSLITVTPAACAQRVDRQPEAQPPEGWVDKMAMAFGAADDGTALAVAKSILETAPKNAAAAAVLHDLNGRKERNRFGVRPDAKPPADLDAWIKEKQTTRLIEALEDVCAKQDGWPAGVDLTSDWRVEALIRIGDPAVSALIDVIEKDARLTRSVHNWRPGVRCKILAVREAALFAVMDILQVRVFEPASPGDTLTDRGSNMAPYLAGVLREYWTSYGGFPFDERMMAVLRDPKAGGERIREAATSLASMDEEGRFDSVARTDDKTKAPPVPRRNPAIAKFSNPTAAEAIFAAMKRELAAFDGFPWDDTSDKDLRRGKIEDVYAGALTKLGDPRIAPSLVAFAASVPPRHRILLAGTAHTLGDPAALVSICSEVANAKWPAGDDSRDLDRLLHVISTAAIPEADAALKSLEHTAHPLRAAVIFRAAEAVQNGNDLPAWILRPFTVRLLVSALNDNTPTGWMYSSRTGDYNYSRLNGEDGWSTLLPAYLSGNAARRREAPELRSDQAAVALGGLIWTLPRAHPLFTDNAPRMEKLREAVGRHRFRPETRAEHAVKQQGEQGAVGRGLLPDLTPLHRPATPEDVAAGKAVFTLRGEGTVAPVPLPARAVFTADARSERPRTAIIVQAEKAQDGTIHYGALFRGGLGLMTDQELTDVKPLEEAQKNNAAAE